MLYNTKITEFNTVFNEEIFKPLIDTLFIYNLLQNNSILLRKHETKNFITHFVLFYCTRLLKDITINKNIIVIQPSVLINEELSTYCDIVVFKKIITKILKDLQKFFPCNVIFLKKECDINNPDTLAYIFNKSNKYVAPNLRPLKASIVENNIKTNNLNLSAF